MQHTINSGTPLISYLGTDDQSYEQIPREPIGQPQHMPKFFIFAAKGKTTPQICGGAERDLIYSKETFDPRSIYSTHATPFANIANRAGNQCMYQRLIPEDANTANIALWLDVLAEDIPVYERMSDGAFETDAAGDKVPTGNTTPGFICKWVKEFDDNKEGLIENFANRSQKVGSQVNGAGETSVMYPIMDTMYDGAGSKGNDAGYKIWAPVARNESYNKSYATKLRVFPYFMAVMTRGKKNYSYKAEKTLLGETTIAFSFKENAENIDTGQSLYIQDIFTDSYSNDNDTKFTPVYGDFSETFVYDNQVAEVLAMFHEAEIPFIDANSDFTDDPEDMYLFNMVSGVSLSNKPYTSFQMIDEADSIRMTKFTVVAAEGGTDGDISRENYENLCAQEFERYLDPSDEYQDIAYNSEADIYDSGFSIATKFALVSCIALRPDIYAYFSPFVAGEADLTRSEELGVMIALMSRIESYPESTYFATPAMRALVLPGSCRIRNNLYKERVPLLIEVINKAANMMGAANGEWKAEKGFDSMPGSELTISKDINYNYMPVTARELFYDAGLNWVHRYKRRSFCFPMLKSVYSEPGSALNSYFMGKAICYVNKVVDAVWRTYCGNVKLTGIQLVSRINEDISASCTRKVFAGYIEVIPRAEISEMDNLRNFSITVPIEVYGSAPRTVIETHIISRNIKDLKNQGV